MKQAWQEHIEAAATIFEDARSAADSSSEGNFLESLSRGTSSSADIITNRREFLEHLDGVFLTATKLWKNLAFIACIKKVLRMKHHVFDISHRLSLIHISEPTRRRESRMPSSA